MLATCDGELRSSKGVRVGKIPLHLAGRCFDIAANCKIPHVLKLLSMQAQEYLYVLHSTSESCSVGLSSVSAESGLYMFRYEPAYFLTDSLICVYNERRLNLRDKTIPFGCIRKCR